MYFCELQTKIPILLRYFLEFSYNGKHYHGWQYQPNAISVQEVLEKALSMMLRTPIELIGAGRTDAGVHAKQMFAHFDIQQKVDSNLVHKLNSYLPYDIAITGIHPVKEDSHARFDATQRTYEYWLTQKKSPFLNEYAYYINLPLDIEAMNKAAEVLFSYNDFQCFSKSNTDVKTYLCDISHAQWTLMDEKLVFTITADVFYRNMVRAIVGTLLEVGLGKSSIENVKTIIESKNRSKAGVSVPAHALYLTKVIYPSTVFRNL